MSEELQEYGVFIDGESRPPRSGEWFTSDNPFTGQAWARVARGGAQDVDDAVEAAHRALRGDAWAGLSASARGRLVASLGGVIADNAARLAEIETRDNGKLYAETHTQLTYMPEWFRYYGGLADKVEGAVIPIDKQGFFTYTRKEPVGATAMITPWNSPLFLLAWKLAPALAAGCTVVVKPSEFTSASTVELARLLTDSGLPAGVLNVVTGFGAEVGGPLVAHPLVRKVSFTGSDQTGRRISELAAPGFKHVSLELGGKSPNIVFADADLDAAVNGVVAGILGATGQTCVAGSRLLVQSEVHDEVVARVVEMARAARMGDPRDERTQIGPITTPPQYQKVLDYIGIAKDEGARLELGGAAADRPECGTGWFVEPTVFTQVDNNMRIAQEEVFGPVLAVIPFEDESDAIRIANGTRYGLGAGVWTRDMGRAFRMSEQIRSGTVWVNTYRAVSYLVPFGGFADSGMGRENGIQAIEAYLETKAVWINTSDTVANPFVMR